MDSAIRTDWEVDPGLGQRLSPEMPTDIAPLIGISYVPDVDAMGCAAHRDFCSCVDRNPPLNPFQLPRVVRRMRPRLLPRMPWVLRWSAVLTGQEAER